MGPSFAIVVFLKKQTIGNVVSKRDSVCKKVDDLFSVRYLRVVGGSDGGGADRLGVEKSVLAIGMGMGCESSKTKNTKRAVITQGTKENVIISKNNGGKSSTNDEICAICDISLT